MSNLTYFYIRRWSESRSREQNTDTGKQRIFSSFRTRADVYASSEDADRSSDSRKNDTSAYAEYRINTNR